MKYFMCSKFSFFLSIFGEIVIIFYLNGVEFGEQCMHILFLIQLQIQTIKKNLTCFDCVYFDFDLMVRNALQL